MFQISVSIATMFARVSFVRSFLRAVFCWGWKHQRVYLLRVFFFYWGGFNVFIYDRNRARGRWRRRERERKMLTWKTMIKNTEQHIILTALLNIINMKVISFVTQSRLSGATYLYKALQEYSDVRKNNINGLIQSSIKDSESFRNVINSEELLNLLFRKIDNRNHQMFYKLDEFVTNDRFDLNKTSLAMGYATGTICH